MSCSDVNTFTGNEVLLVLDACDRPSSSLSIDLVKQNTCSLQETSHMIAALSLET